MLLTIFLTPFFFKLWDYTINIDGNVHNIFVTLSALFRIRCMFLLNTINISLHVSDCGIYFLSLIIELIQHLLYLTDGFLLCCKHAFIP